MSKKRGGKDISEKDCHRFAKDSTTNPLTGRAIEVNGKALEEACSRYADRLLRKYKHCFVRSDAKRLVAEGESLDAIDDECQKKTRNPHSRAYFDHREKNVSFTHPRPF